jgi:hypothetical protein
LSVDIAGEMVQTGPDYVVCAPARLSPRLFQVTNLLRARGYRVIHGTVRKHPDEAIETAVEELRRYRATAALVLGAPGFSSDEVMMIENHSSGPAVKRSGRSRSKARAFKRVTIQALADVVGRTASS